MSGAKRKRNLLDRAIGYFSPSTALKREYARYSLDMIQNSGYSNYGASHRRSFAEGWKASGGSAIEDIHDNLQTLRERSRDLTMGVPLAASAIKTYRTNVIGPGLTPKPAIDGEFLGLSEQQVDELEQQISREFYVWADATNCDAERMKNFYELQQLALTNWLMSGDVFAVLQMKERKGATYELCVLLIEADRVCTPNELGIDLDDKIVGGVEFDETGEVVAYHIANHHPLSYRNTERKWTRVPAFGAETGRRNILHIATMERIGQRRGVPILAPIIEALKQLGRYTDAELMAAVISGMITVFIEKETEKSPQPFGEWRQPEEDDGLLHNQDDRDSVKLGPGAVVDLAAGEHANTTTPGRPNAGFNDFVAAISRQIGAALELPYEILIKQFTNSYSASRAALLEAWKSFSMWRTWVVDKFCQPIYEEWFAEAVARGRIRAPGFFDDEAIRMAYTSAQWYGPTQGQLDPVKEVTAAELRVRYGLSTRAKEAMELTGTDFMDNIHAIRRENELMKEAGVYAEDKAIGNSRKQ